MSSVHVDSGEDISTQKKLNLYSGCSRPTQTIAAEVALRTRVTLHSSVPALLCDEMPGLWWRHPAVRDVHGHAAVNRSAIFLMDLSLIEIILRRRRRRLPAATPARPSAHRLYIFLAGKTPTVRFGASNRTKSD